MGVDNGGGTLMGESSVSMGMGGDMGGVPVVQRAGEERSQNGNEGGSPTGQPVMNEPEPDLDALAQQVYAILKRRLAVEQRRSL
jgi:hypothetical protein